MTVLFFSHFTDRLYIQLCAGANSLFVLKLYCQDLPKTRGEELALKRHGQLFVRVTLLNMHL